MCVTLFGEANWSDQVVRKCCLLKNVIEGMTEGKIEKGRKYEEDDVSSYGMILGKRKHTET